MKIKCGIFTGHELVRYAHAKLDGHFVRLFTDKMGLVHLHTPTPMDITHQVDRKLIYNFERLAPPSTSCVGELFVPGQKASQVKRMLASDPSQLQLELFAVEHWNGHPLALDLSLEQVDDLITSIGMKMAYYEKWNGDIDGTLTRFLGMGCEGVMLKYANLEGWYKLKPVKTVDLIVTELKPGKGKYAGQVGALICGTAEGHVIANCSGMDDAEREAVTPADIGRVCEVRYQYVGAGGRLRHPAFVRWRDDKLPHECLITQDPELEEHYASH